MKLLAIAGGAGPGGADMLLCCGMFPVLPLVVVLARLAVTRGQSWPAVAALLLSGLPFVVLVNEVTRYQPSDDGDVMADQETGRLAFVFYSLLVATAAASILWVMVRGSADGPRKSAEPGAAADRGLSSDL